MKLQKISDIEQTLYFTEYDFLQLFSKSFPFTELGRIYELLENLTIKKFKKMITF